MLFYTVFIFLQLTRAVLSTVDLNVSSANDISVKRLFDVIETFHKHTQEGDDGMEYGTAAATNDVGNKRKHLNSLYGIENLNESFTTIFRQMSSYYRTLLPEKVKIEAGRPDDEYELNYEQFKSVYAETICLYAPRGLDFTYMNNEHFSSVITLYNLHWVLCYLVPKFIREKCHQTDDEYTMIYTCKKTNIILLLDSVFPIEFNDVHMLEDYQTVSQDFVLNVFNIINNNISYHNTDKRIAKSNSWKNKFMFSDYEKCKLPSVEIKLSYVSKVEDENSAELITIFDKLIAELMKENTIVPDIDRNDENLLVTSSVPHKISQLLLNAYRELTTYIRKNIFTYLRDYVDKPVIKEYALKTIVSKMFDRFCEFTPLILHYLSDNNVNDAELFGLYFTLCGDYMAFLNSRCLSAKTHSSEKDDNSLHVDCVTQSVIDKISVNVETMIKSEPRLMFRVSKKDPTKESLESIVEKIYLAVKTTNYKAGFLWTKHDWLSGKYVFSQDHSSADMDKLKERVMVIDGQPVALLEVYGYLLPFDRSMRTVLFFHKTFVNFIVRMMNTYVYRMARLIILYFDRMQDDPVAGTVYDNIAASVEWYDAGSEIFYGSLYTRAVADRPLERIKSTVEAIKSINETNRTSTIDDHVSQLDEDDLLDWAEIDSLGPAKDVSVETLNRMLKTNCDDATGYIINLISIVNESHVTDTTINIDDEYRSNCDRNEVGNVFVD